MEKCYLNIPAYCFIILYYETTTSFHPILYCVKCRLTHYNFVPTKLSFFSVVVSCLISLNKKKTISYVASKQLQKKKELRQYKKKMTNQNYFCESTKVSKTAFRGIPNNSCQLPSCCKYTCVYYGKRYCRVIIVGVCVVSYFLVYWFVFLYFSKSIFFLACS